MATCRGLKKNDVFFTVFSCLLILDTLAGLFFSEKDVFPHGFITENYAIRIINRLRDA